MRIAARRRDLLSISNYSIGVLPPNCGSKYATTPPAPRPALSHVEGEFPQGKERSSRGEVFLFSQKKSRQSCVSALFDLDTIYMLFVCCLSLIALVVTLYQKVALVKTLSVLSGKND